MLNLAVSALTTAANATRARVDAGLDYSGRVASKVERILDQVIELLDAAAPLLPALVQAVEDGLLDDLRAAMGRVDEAVTTMGEVCGQMERVGDQMTRVGDQAELAMPLLDATGTGLGLVNSTIGTTLGSVQALRGAPFVRRIGRPARGAGALEELTAEEAALLLSGEQEADG